MLKWLFGMAKRPLWLYKQPLAATLNMHTTSTTAHNILARNDLPLHTNTAHFWHHSKCLVLKTRVLSGRNANIVQPGVAV